MAPVHDLIIRGGTVADGRGTPLFEADVGIVGDRIVAVGDLPGRGTEEVDARGLLVTPGFVDIHTHYDGQAVWDSRLASSSWNGVTTAVAGNCGVGFAPVRPDDRGRLIELMEGVEDIPGAVMEEGLDWSWDSFAHYLDVLENRPHDIDICVQLAHGPLRVYVMGERAVRLEPATPHDVATMRRLAAEAMRAGAIGFSSSRSVNHKTAKGDPTPSLRASEEELTGIALGLRDAGHGVISLLSDFEVPDLEAEFAMLRRVVERSGRPLSYSLLQKHNPKRRDDWRRLLALTAEAVADGLPIKAQAAPRPVGTLLGALTSLSPFSGCPSWAEVAAEADPSARMRILADRGFRHRVLDEHDRLGRNGMARQLTHFESMFVLGDPPDYEPDADTSIAAEAERRGMPAAVLAYESMLENDGHGLLYAPFANYADFNLDACREMLADPNTVPGLGDGGAHVGVIADASFPTYLLTHWGRDRPHGRFDLSWLVQRHTRDTARAVGLHDRGEIAPGMKADINVIDFPKLRLRRPQMHYDLPTGGKRLLQEAEGYVATLVSGQVIRRDGRQTRHLPGRLVRARATVR